MRYNFLTLFPERIHCYFNTSILAKAKKNGLIEIHTIQIRDFAKNKHNKVDDTIYGGGPGMLLQIGPIYHALQSLGENKGYVILLSAKGETFHQKMAKELYEKYKTITFISGYYEGVDARVSEHLVDREVGIGNYVLTSGDLAALCIADCICRYIPGFLGKEESLIDESFQEPNLLEYPQYTKPRDFMGWKVPEVLLKGNHKEIEEWRKKHKMHKKNHENS